MPILDSPDRVVADEDIRPEKFVITIVGDFEPCNKGSDQWPGPLDKLGAVPRVELRDPVTGDVGE